MEDNTEIGREICQRTNSAAVLDGSIPDSPTVPPDHQGGQLRNRRNAGQHRSSGQRRGCRARCSGEDQFGNSKQELGESLSTVQKFDLPLEQATTPSLEALKAFSLGSKVESMNGDAAAIPFYKRAIELDPDFTLPLPMVGHRGLPPSEGRSSGHGYTRRAYELRGCAQVRRRSLSSPRFSIKRSTGNIRRAERSGKLWIQAYPRSETPHVYLSGAIYQINGQY